MCWGGAVSVRGDSECGWMGGGGGGAVSVCVWGGGSSGCEGRQ